MTSDDVIRALSGELAILRQRVAALERQVDQTAERQAVFGRPRYLIWGEMSEKLVAGGSADVQLIANTGDGWADKQLMEDVMASPLMPSGTCLKGTVGSPMTVCVAWFPLDEEYYIIGAATCPTTACTDDSSS